ncbi:glycoside hydrolase family 97 protein [Prevotella sp. 10(H)]|uniref:glycoside hydrolase family 97 protein n=1 Tax=Prevotella sp. 10(H) TaxID=1158294 RepID=UPI0004A72ECC|nr:glycoside hydrolase family 97 protein [Prevotella sp. 10(H)]
MKQIQTILLLLFITFPIWAQKSVKLASPDGKLKFELRLGAKQPEYNISYDKVMLIKDSPLSIEFSDGWWGENLKITKPVHRVLKEDYELIVGKSRKVHSHCNEVLIPFTETNKLKRQVNLVVRAFNDGIAFRYEYPKQKGRSSHVIYNEATTFNAVGNPDVLRLHLPGFISSHEGEYTYGKYKGIEENKLMDMPATFRFGYGIYMSITEASVRDYAGMMLSKENGMLYGKLSPKLGDARIKVEAALPHKSPWRTLMISDRLGALIESDILTNLNEPCKIEDTSWIKPGKTTFTWWSGNVVPDTTFSPGNNFETNKYYIDFASRNGLDYHSIYGYAETPWYTDNGFNFGTIGTEVDITKPIAPLNMKYICDYAKSKSVGIHVWLNWRALYPKLDEAFARFEEWGIKGMMVDFMDRDDQEMILIQEEILTKAAKHKLYIQFHGSSKPSGLHRTYPNEFTREGTLNYEVYKWNAEQVNADHDINMPFTRLLAGAADYHLGGFRALPRSEFKIQYVNPFVTSTRCHMLAMYIVLESYLGMVCDTPEAYEGQPGFDFLKDVPTIWDKTVVPDASLREYVAVARQKDGEWYLGVINNSKGRILDIKLDFLGTGTYKAEVYTDAPDAETNPNHLKKEIKQLTAKDILELPLAVDGGAVVRFKPM